MAKEDLSLADLEQVRKILVGQHVKESRDRIDRVESALSKEIRSLRQDCLKRLETLEQAIAKQNEALSNRVREESARHGEVEKNLSKRLTKTAKDLAQRIDQSCAELSDELDVELEDLRSAKVAKEDLSGYFADIALQLVNKKQIRRT